MNHEAWVVLHGGYGQLTLLEYLFGVLSTLLMVAAIAGGVRLCLRVFSALAHRR
jgi:hypothetical protein